MTLVRVGGALLLAGSLGGSTLACGDSCGDADCTAGGSLFVELEDPVPVGSFVEVCFEESCGVVEITAVDGTADEGQVPFDALGDWSDSKDDEVLVRVTRESGSVIVEESGVPEKRGGCCGDNWTARA